MAEAANKKSFLTEGYAAWRTWMLQVGELVRPVTVRLSENELIDLVTKACPLEYGPFSIFVNDVTSELFTNVIFCSGSLFVLLICCQIGPAVNCFSFG